IVMDMVKKEKYREIEREVQRLENLFNIKAVRLKARYETKAIRYMFGNGVEVYCGWEKPYDIMTCLHDHYIDHSFPVKDVKSYRDYLRCLPSHSSLFLDYIESRGYGFLRFNEYLNDDEDDFCYECVFVNDNKDEIR
ncbi:hypothetical protein, partial [Gluconobacter sp. P1D12_c]|uniref:hypothetical protein n=5 Tax=Gluconobacter sp. P1D12_c TaxID=2762614 RepID=UPI001C054A72